MIAHIVDTNVLSELRRGTRCHPTVANWQKSVEATQYISVISLFEIRKGIRKVRRTDAAFADKLEAWYQNKVKRLFAGFILLVHEALAEAAAELHDDKPQPYSGAFIAATAIVYKLPVATHNLKDSLAMGVVDSINPWEDEG